MSNETVLIVDDDQVSVANLSAALGRMSLASEVATSGASALEKIEKTDYHLVLLDITLSDIDGWQVLRRLRHIHPHLPVVLTSKQPSVEDVVDAMRQGAVDVLEKPIQQEHLQEVVSNTLQRRAAKDAPGIEYDAFIDMAETCLKQASFDDAVEHLKSAISLAPGRPEAFNLLGAVHEKRGNRDRAVKFYRAACGLDLMYKPAGHNLERLTVKPSFRSQEIELDDG